MRKLFLFTLLATSLLSTTAYGKSFYCGPHLISEGDSFFKAQAYCQNLQPIGDTQGQTIVLSFADNTISRWVKTENNRLYTLVVKNGKVASINSESLY